MTGWRERLLREADRSASGGGTVKTWHVLFCLVGSIFALIAGSKIERGHAAARLAFFAVIIALGSLWVWVLRRRAIAVRRKRKAPLNFSS
jgi:hypothetical protein